MSPEWLQAIFTGIAALGVVYVAAKQSKDAPRLKFDFEGSDSLFDGRSKKVEFSREGLIRNLSSQQDTISWVGIVAWTKRHRRYDFFSRRSDIKVYDRDKKLFKPPFNIPGRTTVQVTIKVKNLDVTDNLIARSEMQGVHITKKLDICFETTDGSWFTEKGKFVDIKSASIISHMRDEGYAGWKPKSWFTQQFWYLDWELTKSMTIHTRRQFARLFGF